MTREFKLSDGRTGRIEIDDKLIEMFGDEWVEAQFEEAIRSLEENKSQE